MSDNVKHVYNELYAKRVNQLHALSLDYKISSIFRSKLVNIKFLNKYEPEFETLIKLYIWWHTIYRNGQTIGQSLLKLSYYYTKNSENVTNILSTRQKCSIALFDTVLPWISLRLSNNFRYKRASNAIELMHTLYSTLNFVNFLLFLRSGRYRSLWERLLCLECGLQSPQRNNQSNGLNYSYMNRELLWQSFAEFLVFILPLINFYKVRNTVMNFVRTRVLSNADIVASNVNERVLSDLKCCVICNEWPIDAHEIGCRHVFCYYCCLSRYLSDQTNFKCPICFFHADSIDNIKRVKLSLI